MTLPQALRKALDLLRKERRTVVLATSKCRYRLVPTDWHQRGFLILLSVHYNDEWQPWSTVGNFDIDDILTDKWRVA